MVVPEMLAQAGNIIFLNVKDDYYLVLPPDKDLSNTDARRAFLQYVVDPLVFEKFERYWFDPRTGGSCFWMNATRPTRRSRRMCF